MKPVLFSRRRGVVILLGLLASLVGMSVRVDAQEKQPFARWEKDIAAFERRDKKKAPPRNPIVFVGSSSIRLWDLPKSFPRLPAINRGFGGAQLSDVVHFAPRIVLKYEPRLIVLYAGDNDLGAGKTPQQVFMSFQAFTRIVHKKLPKVRIVFISIKQSLARWALSDKIRQANVLIEAECKKDKSLVYLDIVAPMLGADGKPRREWFIRDGLHMNAQGYALWAERLRPYLATPDKKGKTGRDPKRAVGKIASVSSRP